MTGMLDSGRYRVFLEEHWREQEREMRAQGLFDLANAFQQFADGLARELGVPSDVTWVDRGVLRDFYRQMRGEWHSPGVTWGEGC
jgi:hypothetical protein